MGVNVKRFVGGWRDKSKGGWTAEWLSGDFQQWTLSVTGTISLDIYDDEGQFITKNWSVCSDHWVFPRELQFVKMYGGDYNM